MYEGILVDVAFAGFFLSKVQFSNFNLRHHYLFLSTVAGKAKLT